MGLCVSAGVTFPSCAYMCGQSFGAPLPAKPWEAIHNTDVRYPSHTHFVHMCFRASGFISPRLHSRLCVAQLLEAATGHDLSDIEESELVKGAWSALGVCDTARKHM